MDWRQKPEKIMMKLVVDEPDYLIKKCTKIKYWWQFISDEKQFVMEICLHNICISVFWSHVYANIVNEEEKIVTSVGKQTILSLLTKVWIFVPTKEVVKFDRLS